jgi:hypothetical protein
MITSRDTWIKDRLSVRRRRRRRKRTEACHVVVEDGKQQGLPSQLGEHGANDADGRGDGEDGKAEPVEFFPPVGPCYGGKRLLGFESVGDVVVGDIGIDGDVGIDVLCLAWVNGRHGGKETRAGKVNFDTRPFYLKD